MKKKYDEIYRSLLEFWGGKFSSRQEEDIAAWLKEEPANEKRLKQLFRLLYRVSYAEKYNRINLTRAEEKILSRLPMREKRGRRISQRLYLWSGAVAACLLLFSTMFWFPEKQEYIEKNGASQILGGHSDITLLLDNGKRMVIHKDSSFVLKMDRVSVEHSVGAGLCYMAKEDSLSGRVFGEAVEYNTLIVPRGGEYILTLSDGTKVWLNSETELKYPVRFTGATREVEIVGEGYFEVAKNEACPFIVHAKDLDMKVLGTSFNVMAYRDENVSVVTLETGKVQVNAATGREMLSPGWQAVWDIEGKSLMKQQVPVNLIVSWKSGMFDFVNMPLEQLVKQLTRWYDVEFSFTDEAIRAIRFTGAVERAQSLKFMLDFIEMTSNVKCRMENKMVYLDKKLSL
ncbi:FecR family protein [Butyricimonas synergistica]|uniref:FecR family protein n=1 Tax=Butyricimonas synergistica TaxID=544644 RepID=UPI0003700F02|nr:FecR domain-containing protein [Butyricimonas synergistica]